MASSGTGTISSLGVGSGIDASSIVSKLVELERQPIVLLEKRAETLQTKISAFGQVQASVSSLRDAAKKLANPDIWTTTKATVSDSSVVSFSTSAGAQTGNYNVQVSSVAASQSVVNKTRLASGASTLGSGTLTFDTGKWTGTSFAAGGTPVTVTIDAADTLEKVRDKINSSGAGVSAAIVNDSGGARLVMTSKNTGAENGFRVTASDDDGNNLDGAGISALAYDLDPGNTTLGSDLSQAAKDAMAKINGVDVTSKNNTFGDVLSGISFTVSKEGSATVGVAQDNETITKAITEFATSYSSLATMLRTNTKYDDATKTAGTLQGDGTAVSILNQFRSAIGGGTGASSVFSTLSSIGVELQASGTLTVNATKLTNALGKLSDVKKLFSNVDNTHGGANDGVATRLRTLADNMLGFEGAITTRTAGLNKAVKDNGKRQEEMDARVALFEKRLRAQYTALDTKMGQISGTSSYVTQMITNWNKS
jgi:flagellar hook-associated protein 2